MNEDLTVLAKPENHDNLLLAEAAAWLHDFLKCTDEHINRQALEEQTTQHSTPYRRKYLQLVGSHQVRLLTDSASFEGLINKSRRESWLVRTLVHCHNVAHTEKEEVFYHVQKQAASNTRSSSSFGYESQPLRGLSNRLYHIPFNQIANRSDFKPALEKAFSYASGDTRRPINEVTLWDWSSMVAALYKAALAASVLNNTQQDPPKMRWRLLSVRFDGAAFSERVARIPDLLARRKLIADGLDKVCKLLEETYPLGTEVYRDEDGSVFLVPCIDELLDLKDERDDKLSTRIIREFHTGTIEKNSALRLDGEVVPSIEFDKTEFWFRKTMPYYSKGESYAHQPPLPVAKHVKETTSNPDPDKLRYWWQGHREDICTVCQLRPQGWEAPDNEAHYNRRARGKKCPSYCQTCKALERRVCGICEQRREERSKRWATDKDELHTTIWIDEIADVHGRIALVVGGFDLEHWIDGKMLFYPAELTALQ